MGVMCGTIIDDISISIFKVLAALNRKRTYSRLNYNSPFIPLHMLHPSIPLYFYDRFSMKIYIINEGSVDHPPPFRSIML